MDDCCAICMNSVKRTRQTPGLKCGHLFHNHCIDDWKKKGGERCPICRKMLNGVEYRVTLNIENLNSQTSNVIELSINSIQNLINELNIDMNYISTEIQFDIDNLEELNEIISEFGVSNVNSLIFHTER